MIPSLGFMQFDPQLTIKLLIFFNLTLDFNQLSPYSSTCFVDWSLCKPQKKI